MVDAGLQILADAGVEAGGAMKDAGVAIGEAGSHAQAQGGSGDSGASAGDGLPRAHWILRDRNGTPVQAADLGPVWSTAGRLTRPRFTAVHGDCVQIGTMGQREIGLAYSLATGKLDGCETYAPTTTWREAFATYLIAFTTSSCDGAGYSMIGGNHVQRVGSTYYYVDGAPTHVATYYTWNGSTCTAVSPAGGRDIWAFKPVPQDVVNLLPAAPYALELAY